MIIHDMSIRQLQKAMKSNALSSVEICNHYFTRIAEYDSCKNGFNSVAEINPDAIFIAEQLDSERQLGEVRGPMHGIPVMLKDNIDTADKMHTTAGSLALKENFAYDDAGLVKNLREAGAVIIGKTNLTEFANAMTYGMPGGYSSRGGQVHCSYDKTKNPSGSSAGSAVAVSTALTSVSIGTETSGSILSPAQRNGIVGIKPTKGLIPGDGIIPISGTLDTAGPMGRNVMDTAILLEAMSGKPKNYISGIRSSTLRGMRIGLNKAYMDIMDEAELSKINVLVQTLKKSGAIITDDIDIPFNKALKDIMTYEFKNSLNHYLSMHDAGSGIRTVEDIVEFNKLNKRKTLKYGQRYLLKIMHFTSGRMIEPEYLKAIAEREKCIRMLDSLMNGKSLDIIIHANKYNNLAAFAGFPSMTIPTGIDADGMPMGTQMMARRYDESTLIKAAYALEQVLDLNIAPPGI